MGLLTSLPTDLSTGLALEGLSELMPCSVRRSLLNCEARVT
jgi:hypothetical protein